MSEPQAEQVLSDLRDSLRSGYLFGNRDEPLDAYARRIVRVIELRLTTALAARADHQQAQEEDLWSCTCKPLPEPSDEQCPLHGLEGRLSDEKVQAEQARVLETMVALHQNDSVDVAIRVDALRAGARALRQTGDPRSESDATP